MNSLWQDLRYGARMLLKQPAFTFVAVLTLAIGIGANTAIFSLLDKLLLRTLPVKDAEQLVLITAESINPKFLNNIFSYPDFTDYRDRNQDLSGLFAFIQVQTKFGTADDAPNLRTELVSGNYFDALGVAAANGRAIGMKDEREEGAHPVAVLSHSAWQRRFGSAPDIVGQNIILNGVTLTVIGIAPRGFAGMKLENPTEVWVPLMMRRDLLEATDSIRERSASWLMLAGRLKSGVPMEQAQAGLDLLARNIRNANTPPEQRNVPFYEKRMLMEPGGRGISYLRKNLNQPLTLLMAIVGLLLLIACANVANLLMARATTRHREIAVRLALGAGRWQIVRQLLVESWLLAGVGAVAGMLAAPWLYELPLLFQPNLAVAQTVFESSLDGRVLAFIMLLTALTGTISGLAPAWQSARFDLVPALKDADANLHSHERRFNVRNLLVVGQIALSLVMVIGAGLLVRSLQRLLAVDTGFRAENVLIVPVELSREKFNGAGDQQEFLRRQDEKNNAFFRQAVERVRALPGVEAVSTAAITPMSGSFMSFSANIEGWQPKPGENLAIDANKAGPGYHELMGMQIVQGRGFTEQDRAGALGVIIINETMARVFFPNQNPLGKRINDREVVGVVRDAKLRTLTDAPIPHFDLPALQDTYGSFARLVVRAKGKPEALIPAVRSQLRALNSNVALNGVTTLSQELNNSIAATRMATALTGLYGLMALLLAAIGLYGVMTYVVSRRTREIGVRMAIGAQGRDVLRMVIGHGMSLALIGIGLGVAASLGLTRLIQSLLFQVNATDPLTFVVITGSLIVVAALACYLPARRATKVDPMVALKCE